jgi:hypothetical protein
MKAYVAHICSATGTNLRYHVFEARDMVHAAEVADAAAQMGEWVMRIEQRDRMG